MTIGMDFGTTNSSIVYRSERGTTLIEVGAVGEPYSRVVRTAVFAPGTPAEAVGMEAFTAAARNGGSEDRLLVGFKPKLNKERLREVVRIPTVLMTSEYDAVNETSVTRTEWTSEARYDDVSRDQIVAATAATIRRLIDRLLADPEVGLTAEALRGEDIYLGVPVGYGPTARRRLLDAIVRTEIYGPAADAASYRSALERVKFVFEPIALIADSDVWDPETVLVFDYGGGTLDLGIWRVDPDERLYRELAFGGHPAGGDRIDILLLDHLVERHEEYSKAVHTEGARPYDTMRRVAAAKEALATSDSYHLQEGGADPIDVTRVDLEQAVAGEMERIAAAVEACVDRAGVGRHEIDRIVMSGGSSLLSPVRDLLWRLFPTVPSDGFQWLDAASVEDSRRALTGVAQGLAEFGWAEGLSETSQFEQRLPADLVVWSEREGNMVALADHGTLLGNMPLRSEPSVGSGTVSFAIYERFATERFVACLPDVKVKEDEHLALEIEPRRYYLAPRVRALVGDDVRAVFDVDQLSDAELKRLLQSDREWPPGTDGPTCGFLARRLQVGDCVRVPRSQLAEGVVTAIRRIRDDGQLKEMDSWKLGSGGCQVTVTSENGGVGHQHIVESHQRVHLR